MKVSMPVGNDVGWEIAGSYLGREIAKLPAVDGVTLHCIPLHDFEPRDRNDWNDINIGYCFFEHDILAYHSIPKASKQWDFIVAGSKWCEYHLRLAGVKNTTTILQGVDPELFFNQGPRHDDGRFIVFSGGKFEFRKGQDVVIAAMRIFMERHPDVWLSCAWHNHWGYSIKTMEQSRYINYSHTEQPCEATFMDALVQNGIDTSRVIIHPRLNNNQMPEVYGASDIGLFPNRCEGGNNMVMCEYMATGRPVIASTWSGHGDVVTSDNAFKLAPARPVVCRLNQIETGVWFEPDPAEVLMLLERAYHERPLFHLKGAEAARSMSSLVWKESARRFHAIAQHLASSRRKTVAGGYDGQIAEAERLFSGGHYSEAESAYRELLKSRPLDSNIYNCLGTVLDRLNRLDEAILYYQKAIALVPSNFTARYNLANTLKRKGALDEAMQHLQKVVELSPDFLDAWQNLGVCFFEQKTFVKAAECFEIVVARDPERSGCFASMGEIYFQLGYNYLSRGLECLEAVLDRQPGNIELINLKGLIFHELELYDQAEKAYRKGLAIEPHNSILISNLANMYQAIAQPEKAVMNFNLALQIEPGNASILFNRAMSRLLMGDYLRGWEDYEARFQKQEPVVAFHQHLPRWHGENLKSKTLLVWSEQVYGDTIQFSRFLPMLKKFEGKILYECLDSTLSPLFLEFSGFDQMIIRGELVPEADYQVPLASIPGILGITDATIPSKGGYLHIESEKKQKWSAKISKIVQPMKTKVGIVWGGRKPRLNANRSLLLKFMSPLFEIPDLQWFSLQLGEDRQQIFELKTPLHDLGDEIKDFSDTAAIIESMDLIISIDTAVAHLSGALGAPVWVMLKYSPDWRWLLDRDDSPWYKSARLFRQSSPGDWNSVIMQIHNELKNFLPAEKSSKGSD